MAETVHLEHPFGPIYDADSRVLILGSFPSVISRKKSFYYANHANRFWKVMAAVYNEEIIDPVTFVHDHHIALWDVIASCTITGSSDASIRDVVVNDIEALVQKTKIETVFTTGVKAASLYEKYVVCSKKHIALPSTSGANARMKLDDLIQAYSIIKENIDEKD